MVRWKEVPGFSGQYSVSDDGRIRRNKVISRYRTVKTKRILRPLPEMELKQGEASNGFYRIGLTDPKTGKGHMKYIHRVVMEVFGHSVQGIQLTHLDGDKSNNRIENIVKKGRN